MAKPKINRTIRYNGMSYRAGQEEDLKSLPAVVLARLEKRGSISGFTKRAAPAAAPAAPPAAPDETDGFSGVLIRDLEDRLAGVNEVEEVERLRGLDSRPTAARFYDARISELQDDAIGADEDEEVGEG